jgi:hypothetical protein
MNTPLYDKVLKILSDYATASEREVALRELMGMDPIELEPPSENDDLANQVADAFITKLGLEPNQDPQAQERAVMARLYPSLAGHVP